MNPSFDYGTFTTTKVPDYTETDFDADTLCDNQSTHKDIANHSRMSLTHSSPSASTELLIAKRETKLPSSSAITLPQLNPLKDPFVHGGYSWDYNPNTPTYPHEINNITFINHRAGKNVRLLQAMDTVSDLSDKMGEMVVKAGEGFSGKEYGDDRVEVGEKIREGKRSVGKRSMVEGKVKPQIFMGM